MKFTRLRLSGFKSFVEPTELFVEPGLTAVIGPNDVLKVIDSEQVVMEMKGPNLPGAIKVGADFTYVVMPVSLR